MVHKLKAEAEMRSVLKLNIPELTLNTDSTHQNTARRTHEIPPAIS